VADENEVIDPDDENTEGAKDGAEDFSNTDDDTKNQSSGNESDDDGEFDAAAEFAALEQKFDEGAVTRADFDAFKASVQRGLGQVSRLQSNVDRAAQSAVDPTDVEAIGEQVALLTEALTASVDPSDPLMARLAAAKAKQAATEATRAAVAKIRAETEAANPGAADDDGTGNQMSPARKAELNEASSLAKGYAKAKGVDIPEAAWAEAMTKSNGDTAAAVTTLYEIIDGIAKPDTTQIERTRRKAAGSTGNPPKNGKGGSSASLTFEALSQMSEAEVGVLLVDHEDEINRVLAKGPDA
jgi:hypothetical protein